MSALVVLEEIDWLAALWQPLEDDDNAKVVATPDEFFERVYESPYENWCVEDQENDVRLPAEYEDIVKNIARRAYEAAWEKFPNPEFCALINDAALRPFTAQRLQWYQNGRVPCGYSGDFPDGVWFVV